MATTMTRPAVEAPPPGRRARFGWLLVAAVVVTAVTVACFAAFGGERTAELGGTVTAIDGPLDLRSQPATVALGDGSVLIWSGRSTTTDSGSVYDPATGTWEQLPPAPGRPRFSAAATWTGTEAIIWGGSPSDAELFLPDPTGIAWNPSTGTWRELPVAPIGLMDARAVAFETGVLFTGGKNSVGTVAPVDLWFSLVDETWTTVANPSEVLNVAWQHGTLLGAGRPRVPSTAGASRASTWTVGAFDERTRSWSPVAPSVETPWLALATAPDGALTAVAVDMEQIRGLALVDGQWVDVATTRSGVIPTIEPSSYPPVVVWTGEQLVLGGAGGLVGWSPATRTFATTTDPRIRAFGASPVWNGQEIVSLSSQSSEGWTWSPPVAAPGA